MSENFIPAKIIADAACSYAARRAVVMSTMLLSPTRSEMDFPGGEHQFRWCTATNYKTAIASAVLLCRPANFMEIGVRRGHAMATAALLQPGIDLCGFDPWPQQYGGESNPGADFVRAEIRRIGHSGEINLYQGRSQETVPKFHELFPEVRFDLIGIDGSHKAAEASEDIANCLPLLAIGGILIFDDIAHPEHMDLLYAWRQRTEGYERHEVLDCGYGFGILRKTHE
jgi:predicted O-methyltransferase YrrM